MNRCIFIKQEKIMNFHFFSLKSIVNFMFGLSLLATSISAGAHQRNLDALDANTHIRTPITHGFWFPKLVTFGEEWYRGRLLDQGGHTETGELPDASDPDGHRGFTAINATRWLISHHWFGEDEIGEEQLYSRNPNWFFDPVNPSNSVMGVFAMFRWGLLNEDEARLAIHNMIKSYTDREYSILRDGVWIYAMADLSTTDFTVNDGSRVVPNPLGIPDDEAIRNEIFVIITHHFFGRNRNNTVKIMNNIYHRLVHVLINLNNDTITDEQARLAIVKLVSGKKRY
jgi:hypothetical protein